MIQRRGARGLLAHAIAFSVALAACAGVDADYFARPAGVAVTYPSPDGTPIYLGLGTIKAHPGDEVLLEGVEFREAAGFEELTAVVRPVTENPPAGLVGIIAEADLVAAGMQPDAFLPIAGYELRDAQGRIEVVVRAVAGGAIARFKSVVITFRVDGGPRRTQDFPYAATACPDDVGPDPTDACTSP